MRSRGFNLTSHRIWLMLAMLAVAASLLAACAPSLPTGGSLTDQTTASPGVHLLIDGDASMRRAVSNHIFIVALDARTGHVRWRHQLASAANSQVKLDTLLGPFVSGHLVFVTYTLHDSQTGEEHGTLEALDLTSGQLRWRHEAGPGPLSFVSVGSAIYTDAVSRSHDRPASGVVEALDLTSGRLLWSRPVPNPSAALAVGGDKVVVFDDPQASDGGLVVALKASDGSLLWDYSSPTQHFVFHGHSFSGYPALVIGNQLVYLDALNFVNGVSQTGSLLALNADDGKVAWQHPYGNAFPSILNQSGGILCLREFWPGSHARNLIVGLDAKTGQTRWSVPYDGDALSCVAGSDAFYISDDGGPGRSLPNPPHGMIALASEDGHQLWHSHTIASVVLDESDAPWVAHGLVGQVLERPLGSIVLPEVVVYRADSGALVWRRELQGTFENRLSIEGDQIYITRWIVQTNQIGSETVTALSLSTGAILWTYEVGHM